MLRTPVYTVKQARDVKARKDYNPYHYCVVLKDYTSGQAEFTVPQFELSQEVIKLQAETIAMLRTAMMKAVRADLLRVQDVNTIENVINDLSSIEKTAFTGRSIYPIHSLYEIQDISADTGSLITNISKVHDSLQNIRLSFLGVDNDGAFQKSSHKLESEVVDGGKATKYVRIDRIRHRQRFSAIANILFDTSFKTITPLKNEVVLEEMTIGEEDKGGDEDVLA
jgi:Cdc6-like AAA superfamily ATPase